MRCSTYTHTHTNRGFCSDIRVVSVPTNECFCHRSGGGGDLCIAQFVVRLQWVVCGLFSGCVLCMCVVVVIGIVRSCGGVNNWVSLDFASVD